MFKKLLKLSFIAFIAFALFIGGWIASYVLTHPEPTVASATQTSNLDAYKIYNLVNDYRASKGLNKLAFDPRVCDYSEKRLKEILTNFSHDGYHANPPFYRWYDYQDTGENLARGYESENTTVDSWIASPTHLENIVKPTYKITCISTSGNYAVQQFSSGF